MPHPQRILGRTNVAVPFVWRAVGPDAVGAEGWCALEIGPDALERRGDPIVEAQLNALGRASVDLVIVHGIASSDLKIGWPMHRLQQLRDRGWTRFFAIETDVALEAEWIAANAPVHAVVVAYGADEMAIRYRVFEVAQNAGVAIVARARSVDDAALHLVTPQIAATISEHEPADDPIDAEAMWQRYASAHPAPPKLRSGHPPETGA